MRKGLIVGGLIVVVVVAVALFAGRDTWATAKIGTVYVANMLRAFEGTVGITHVSAAVREAARRLGNTPAICRKSYVHPKVLDPATWAEPRTTAKRARRGLYADEAALLALLAPVAARKVRAPRRTPRPRVSIRPSSPAPASPP